MAKPNKMERKTVSCKVAKNDEVEWNSKTGVESVRCKLMKNDGIKLKDRDGNCKLKKRVDICKRTS